MPESAHVAIIGAGPGGYVAAIRAAQLGLQVTLIESTHLGGVCLNWGCIPSKALLHAGHVLDLCQSAKKMGIEIDNVSLNWTQTQRWKNSLVDKLVGGIKHLLKSPQITTLMGQAQFDDAHTLTVTTQDNDKHTLHADAFIIATGSDTMPLPGLDVDGHRIWDARHALSCTERPEKLLIVGAGVIGLEMAIMFQQLGTDVQVVEKADTLLPGWDRDVVQCLAKALKRRKIAVQLNVGVDWVERHEHGVDMGLTDGSTTHATAILVAAGRLPNSHGLNLDAAGVQVDSRGFIPVDNQCRTNIPHIYAIGDVASAPLLAHKASKEGIVAAEVIAGQASALDYQAMPAAVFTTPELASVGWTVEKAEQAGHTVNVGVFPMGANARGLIENADAGCLVKVVADAETDRVLGVHMAGPHVADLLAEATLAIEMGATTTDLALTIHAHPTLPETVMEAAEAVHQHAIHIYNQPAVIVH
jgi:dihydrolipoamide dehydrogenase